jgi:zinc/manganese transport system substrate-binding protein
VKKNLRTVLVVAVLAVLAGAGIAEAYVLSTPPAPCAGVTTPTGPSGLTSAAPPRASAQSAPSTAVMASATSRESSSTPYDGDLRLDSASETSASPGLVINVVAAENFWGSLVSQIGGTHVSVTSIITDPNTDPHEYQSNASTAIAFENAQYIIINNVGYDSWANLLVASDGNPNQTILNIGDSLGVYASGDIVTGNPHLWYNPGYVNQTVAWMYHNLTTIAPSLSSSFTSNYNNLTASLGLIYGEVGVIKQKFADTVVASTESIFVYLANATGLNLVSPPEFMKAVAEGNDPPDQSVVVFQCQLESGHVRVLVFNAQTVTPVTSNMKVIAIEHNVTVMSVTETVVPPGSTFQVWMGGEINALYVALDAGALGK